MCSFLVVDDEPLSVASIQKVFHKYYRDMGSVYTAHSGKEAVNKAVLHHPDVVIIDIMMPGINGLEAINKIKEINPGTVFVIISAHDKFQFAKEAIGLGVSEYVLKPVDVDVLKDVIDRAAAMVKERRARLEHEIDYQSNMSKLRPLLEHHFIQAVLFEPPYELSMEDIEEMIGLNSISGRMLTVEFNHDAYSAREILEHVRLQKGCVAAGTVFSRIVAYCDIEDDGEAEELAQRLVGMRIGNNMKIGVGSYCADVSLLARSYEQSVGALKSVRGRSGAHLFSQGDVGELPPYPARAENELRDALLTGNKAQAEERISELISWYGLRYDGKLSHMLKGMTQIVALILRWEKLPSEEPFVIDIGEQYDELFHLKDGDAMKSWFVALCGKAIDNLGELKPGDDDSIILDARRYVDGHYCESLTLEFMASKFFLSPSYFSTRFRRVTGVTFIDYLTNIRVKKARDMLVGGGYSIKEVARSVGYSNANYFSRVFKRVTGQTPSDLMP